MGATKNVQSNIATLGTQDTGQGQTEQKKTTIQYNAKN